MRVLVVGGYGFMGSSVTNKFCKEGHKVVVIDSYNKESTIKIHSRHKFYNIDTCDEKCNEIISVNKFDTVIYIPQNKEESESNTDKLDGFKKILSLSSINNVKKFIYISSTDVYGKPLGKNYCEDEEITIDTIEKVEKLEAENYCKIWNENNDINICVLRISNIYGPGEHINELGKISEISLDFINNKNININKEKNTNDTGSELENLFKDYIYIGDVVDAIYKVHEFSVSFCLNISSYILCNNEYINKVTSGEIEKIGASDIVENQGFNNRKAIKELNWYPKYTLLKGIENTYKWVLENKENLTRKETEQIKKWYKSKTIVPYIENILSFIILIIIITVMEKSAMTSIVDLKLVYIAVISIVYGVNQSAIAIALASIFYVISMITNGESLFGLIYNPNTLLNISLYVFIGTVLGYSIDSNKHKIAEEKEKYKELKSKFDFMYGLYNETIEINREIEHQIATTEDSFGKIYKITTELDSLEPENVFSKTIDVVEKIMKSNSVAIYTVASNEQYLRLIAESKNNSLELSKSININDNIDFKSVVFEKKTYVNKKLDKDMPIMMAPVIINDKAKALILIYDINFNEVNLYKVNLLNILASLIKSSLEKAYKYEEAIEKEKYIDDTLAITSKYFNEVINSKEEAMKNGNSSYIILDINKRFEIEIYNKLKSITRDIDFIGVDYKNNMYVLLSNTRRIEAEYVIKRFENKGIKASVVKEWSYINDVNSVSDINEPNKFIKISDIN